MAEKRGRPKIVDVLKLRSMFEDDARFWLEGGDPIKRRSNRSIAKAYARAYPGQSPESTERRIMDRMSKGRRVILFITAEKMSRSGYPYAVHLRAVTALKQESASIGEILEANTLKALKRYREKFGSEPAPEMSFSEIEKAGKPREMKLVQMWVPVDPLS